ncbi:Uu.00g132150.m01.CDS01 [Anthostomella pinea]|uniref:Uu.00g132150.m01.CDS01 n=1 Tax=Anthostomella pinea TaxID=933095 RepID=A0AAI8YIC6_9PEZI|nr:Uu.00g132150.m01.CDS01 [Anthostomella pinea]
MPRFRWDRLPRDIQLIILDLLVAERWLVFRKSPSDQPPRQHLSTYAAVCREWQAFFEKPNFRRLTLHQSDLPELERSVQGHRQQHVRWVWLRFQIPPYSCVDCRKRETQTQDRNHDLEFTRAIWALFRILRSWKQDATAPKNMFILELSAHSPGDGAHYFKELSDRADDAAHLNMRGRVKHPNDRRHHWRRHRWNRQPEMAARHRVFGSKLGLRFDMRAACVKKGTDLAKVPFVSHLIIRRQFHRAFSAKALLVIADHLPRLELFQYEPWRGLDDGEHQQMRDRDHGMLLSRAAKHSSSLAALSIFEDFTSHMHSGGMRFGHPVLAQLALRASYGLQRMCLSFLVDAKDFFRDSWPGNEDLQEANQPEWTNLEYLALTSHALNPLEIDNLAVAAAKAARRMPKLSVMEIWTCGPGYACIFRYSFQKDDRPDLRLSSTWGCSLQKATAVAWQHVAQDRGWNESRTKEVLLDHRYTSHGQIIHLLDLQSTIIDNISWRQLGRESRWYP